MGDFLSFLAAAPFDGQRAWLLQVRAVKQRLHFGSYLQRG